MARRGAATIRVMDVLSRHWWCSCHSCHVDWQFWRYQLRPCTCRYHAEVGQGQCV